MYTGSRDIYRDIFLGPVKSATRIIIISSTKVFNEKYPDVVFTHPTFGLENDVHVYKARISTQMIQLSFFDDRDDLYLVYTFENELPSEKCHVSNREQG